MYALVYRYSCIYVQVFHHLCIYVVYIYIFIYYSLFVLSTCSHNASPAACCLPRMPEPLCKKLYIPIGSIAPLCSFPSNSNLHTKCQPQGDLLLLMLSLRSGPKNETRNVLSITNIQFFFGTNFALCFVSFSCCSSSSSFCLLCWFCAKFSLCGRHEEITCSCIERKRIEPLYCHAQNHAH